MTIDDAHAEQLASKAAAAAELTTSSHTDIQSLYTAALQQRSQEEQQQDEKYLSLAPTFLSLHQQASSSKQLLSSLETFLSTFQSDLSTLSTHISALQTTSHQIDSRLDATRDVEIQLASFLAEIALSPRVVDLFFDSEPESRPELWQKAVKQLERVLEATSPSATLSIPGTGEASVAAPVADVQAVKEVRAVAEACKNVVAAKLRTFLTAPHASIKASVTTNLQVLQTSVLLRHHRPLYAFLARQMPRVAIDVQRSYDTAARLYFETAFRRYARSLGVIRKRWTESSSSSLITDPLPSSSSAGVGYATAAIANLQSSMAALSKAISSSSSTGSTGGGASTLFASRQGGGSTPATRTASQDGSAGLSDADLMNLPDPWLFPATRLQYSKLESPAATVLGYLADDSSFRACPENLFRSLSLVLIDNACSEYAFLVRFFEGVDSDQAQDRRNKSSRAPSSEAGVLGPDESASAIGDDTTTTLTPADEEGTDSGPEPSVVQLSLAEQSRLQNRGASQEIFKQIMEPAIATWTNFTKSLVSPTASTGSTTSVALAAVSTGSAHVRIGVAGYFSLLSMLQLNDALLGLIESRGCTCGVVESALMAFKIQAYPLIKRFLDDQIATLTSLTTPTSTASVSGVWNVLGSLTSSSTSFSLTESLGETIAVRYASLFTKTLWLLADSSDNGILSALVRLRSQLAKLTTVPSTTSWSIAAKTKFVTILIHAIESSLATTTTATLLTHPAAQNEFAFWNQQLKLLSH